MYSGRYRPACTRRRADYGAPVIERFTYLDEFTFRFNRRTSRARGLLFFRLVERAVVTDPVRYRDLVVTPGAGNGSAPPEDLVPKAVDRRDDLVDERR
jgi:hypothetical protein